jgi:hypothetical protein
LILLDAHGKVSFHLIDDLSEAPLITQHQSENPIVKVFPNRKGTRVVCIDNTGNGYLYNPIDDTQLMIPNFSATTNEVLFD